MYKPNTLFIIGAGASAEVGFPVGSQLAEKIRGMTAFERGVEGDGPGIVGGDKHLLSELRRISAPQRNVMNWLAAAQTIHRGVMFNTSIDNFIDQHRDEPHVALCGKLAIARTIIHREQVSPLYVDFRKSDGQFKSIEETNRTWLMPFFRLLIGQVYPSELDKLFERIAIICFNYDRCIEHFLVHAIKNHYAIPIEKAAETVSKLRIYHPYGTLGPLDWQVRESGKARVAFGSYHERMELEPLIKELRTFTESVGTDQLAQIKNEVQFAEQIIILGFSCFPENMRLLACGAADLAKQVYVTAFDAPQPVQNTYEQRIRESFNLRRHDQRVSVIPLSCADLFHHYGVAF
jgi:hypothetical protein